MAGLNSRLGSDRISGRISHGVLTGVAAVVFAAATARATTAVTWTDGSGNTLYNTAANWNPGVVPNGDYAVTIGTPAPTVLNTTASVTSLDVTAGGSLLMSNGNSLTLTQGRTMTLAGSIVVNPEGSGATTALNLPAFDLTLTGGGDIFLNSAAAAINTSGTGAFLNLPAGMSIHGTGTINVVVQNQGTIVANQSGGTLTFLRSPGNGGGITATNGGTVALSFSNSVAGPMLADNGTFRIADTVAVSTATLNSANGGEFDFLGTGSGASLAGTTINGTAVVQTGATVRVSNTLTDNGPIYVGGGTGTTPTGFSSAFDVTYAGTGQIVLQSQSAATISGSSFVTNGVGHTIRGTGTVAASTLFNNGTLADTGTLANLTGATVSVASGATLTVAQLSSSGTITVAGGGTLTAGTFANNYAAVRLGAGGGSGTLTVTTGGLTINSLAGATPTSGLLAGAGTVNANVTLTNAGGGTGATVAPGTAAAGGLLTINGMLTANPGTHIAFDLGGTTAGNGFDVVTDQSAAFGGATLDLALIGTYRPTAADTFVVLSSLSADTGAFANVVSGQRLATTDGLGSFLVTYPAGGTTVTLSNFVATAVPEPTTVAALAGVVPLVLARRRRNV